MYTIVLNNQFCINTLNNFKVLLKFVHAVHQCLDKGSFSKMTSFSLENEAGPRSAVGNVSGYRCVSDCRSRGREFDPGPVPYFRGD